MVVAYRVSRLEEPLRFLIDVPSIVLANLILGENVVPEFIQRDCVPEKLAKALVPLLAETDERTRQLAAFARLDSILEVGAPHTPSERAAAIVWSELDRSRAGPGSVQPRCDTLG